MNPKSKMLTTMMLDRQVDGFNRWCPVGTAVEVTLDNGQILETRTRSEAWVMGGHSAVVMVDKIAGGYSLARVKKAIP